MKKVYSTYHDRWVTPLKRFDNAHTLVLDSKLSDALVVYNVPDKYLINIFQFVWYFLIKQKFPVKYALIIFLGVSALSIKDSELPIIYSESKTYPTYYEMFSKRVSVIKTKPFSLDLFIEYMKLRNVPNKRILLEQTVLETSFFRSQIFKENNNLFGMKHPLIRKTTSLGVNRGHALYNHWTDSIDDYILWYTYVTDNRTYTDYYAFLVKIGYAEDPEYIRKLKTIPQSL